MKRAPNPLRRLSKTTTGPTLWSVVVPDDDEKKEAPTVPEASPRRRRRKRSALQTRSGARAPVPTTPIETIRPAATPCNDVVPLVHEHCINRSNKAIASV